MRTIDICASQNYAVHVGSGILSGIGEMVNRNTNASTICIVSDSNVFPLYGKTVTESLEKAGLHVVEFVFPAGESHKTAQTYLTLLDFLAANSLTRSDCIVALGGGVVGDLAGFTAATYLRGISYIQIPTTLLAMVDSSVGGKTAIDIPAGKNLCGAFYHPAAVLCDIDTLSTLPETIFQDGCAEVIKYAILYDTILFSHLESKGLSFHREAVITRCVELKRDVVTQDEYDRSSRMKLNLGHTIGHAIEKCSDYAVSHGNAVAAGIAMITKASRCSDRERIRSLLQKFHLPVSTDFSADALCACALSDKKRTADTIHLIIPRAIGDCVIVTTSVASLKTLIEEGI